MGHLLRYQGVIIARVVMDFCTFSVLHIAHVLSVLYRIGQHFPVCCPGSTFPCHVVKNSTTGPAASAFDLCQTLPLFYTHPAQRS